MAELGNTTSLDGGEDAFNLIIFSLKAELDTDDIYKFLEKSGAKPCGKAMEFKSGQLNLFFTCVYTLTQIDLLPLIGSELDRFEEEEDYVCGTLDEDTVRKACHELYSLSGTKDLVKETTEKFHLNHDEFLRNVKHLHDLLTEALRRGGKVFGLIE